MALRALPTAMVVLAFLSSFAGAAPQVGITVTATQSPATIRPGQTNITYLSLEFSSALVSYTIREVRVTCRITGPGTAAQRNAEIGTLFLYRDANGNGQLDPASDPLLGSSLPSNGVASFSGLNVSLPGLGSVRLFAAGNVPLIARDGDTFDLLLQSPSDITFQPAASPGNAGDFPLDPNGSFPVDGMTAAQIQRVPIPADSVLAGSQDRVVLNFVLPSNGYETDQLQELTLVNLGTAAPGSDISSLRAWADDGDGVFDAGMDRVLGALLFTGSRWQLTGLAESVPPVGLRVFVTADVHNLAAQGRTIRLRIPAAPTEGVTMQSGNDGPLDAAVENPSALSISTADRVTLAAVPGASADVRPGDRGVPMLELTAHNRYAVTRALQGLILTNAGSGAGTQDELDDEYLSLTLRADGDGDGVVSAPSVDPILGTAVFHNQRAEFGSLSWPVPPGSVTRLFVLADVSERDAADGDTLALFLSSSTDASFGDSTRVVATWPVDSGVRRRVDGMSAVQVRNLGALGGTLAPDEGPALALDVVLPRNGYRDDVLDAFTVTNQGDAGASDLAEVRLWRDGGDGIFSAGGGDDQDRGVLAWQGSGWTRSGVADPIGAGGGRYFVGVTTSAAPRDSATVRLAIPAGGVAVASDNDGPVDALVANASHLLISNSPLIAWMRLSAPASVVGQQVRAWLVARNRGADPITGITATAPAVSGDGTLSLQSGPSPASFDLAPGAVDSVEWIFTASASGYVSLAASAGGVESPSGTFRQSLQAASSAHRIHVGTSALRYTAMPSLPSSVARGESEITTLHLTLGNDEGPDASPVRVSGLRIRIENETGAGIVPSSLLSRVVVATGTEVRLAKTALESTGAEVALDLTSPVLVHPGADVVLSLRLDIASSTSVPSFRVTLPDSSYFTATDDLDGSRVELRLTGSSYPVRTAVARVLASATQLDVEAVPSVIRRAGRGQTGIPLLALRLRSPGLTGITSDIQVTSFAVSLFDTLGIPVDRLADHLGRVLVRTGIQTLEDRVVFGADGSGVTLVLHPPLRVPANTDLDLFLEGDISATARLGPVRLALRDSSLFDARDERTRERVAVVYADSIVQGGITVVEAVVDTLLARGVPRLPSRVVIGSTGITALTGILRHSGPIGEGRVLADTLLVQCRDESRRALDPAAYLSRVRVQRNGSDLATQTVTAGSGFTVALPIGVLLEPGDSVVVDVLVDVSPAAPRGFLELVISAGGIRARDANVGDPVQAVAEPGSELPLLSGLTALEPPPTELAAGLSSALPASLAADGDTVTVGALTLSNTAEPGSGPIEVTHASLMASDRSLARIPIGSALRRVVGFIGGTLWAESGDLTPDSSRATLAGTPLSIPAGGTVALEIRALTSDQPGQPSVRVGCDSSGIGVTQPSGALLQIQVRPAAGQAFPLWTEAGTFGGTDLGESYANYPNPFAAGRTSTTFVYYLRDDARVSLRILTPSSEPVATILEGTPRSRGMNQSDRWDGRNGRGLTVRNGVYVAELVVDYGDGRLERTWRKVAVVR